jgi:uncharacterized protein YciI
MTGMSHAASGGESSSEEKQLLYVLVILRGAANADDDETYAAAHERFISSLIKRNVILLGGTFAQATDGAYGAYVVHCSGVEEARALATEDPLVEHDVVRPQCVEWQLVGINPDAIDAAAVVRPTDI